MALIAVPVAWMVWSQPRGVTMSGPWHIGLDMPLTGEAASRGIPVRNAVQLAVSEINAAGGVAGSDLVLDVYDDAGTTAIGEDPARVAQQAQAIADDDRMVAMIGPWGSTGAAAAIPVTSAAGLLECGPASTSPELTKPEFGAGALRHGDPDEPNFIRLPPAEDILAPALSS